MCVHYFKIISPCKGAWPFIWANLNSLHARILCTKFGLNWLSGSWEEDFWIKSMFFSNISNFSPLEKECGSSVERTWIPATQGCFVPSLVEIGPAILEEKTFKFRQCIFFFSEFSPLGKECELLFEQTWISFTERCSAC